MHISISWFYGFTIPTGLGFVPVQGVFPTLLTIAVCIIGLELCGASKFVPVKAVEV